MATDIDLVCPGGTLHQCHANLEDAGLIGRRRHFGVDVDHDAQAALECAVVHLHLLVDAPLTARKSALAADHKFATVDRKLDVGQRDARQFEPSHELVTPFIHIRICSR